MNSTKCWRANNWVTSAWGQFLVRAQAQEGINQMEDGQGRVFEVRWRSKACEGGVCGEDLWGTGVGIT